MDFYHSLIMKCITKMLEKEVCIPVLLSKIVKSLDGFIKTLRRDTHYHFQLCEVNAGQASYY